MALTSKFNLSLKNIINAVLFYSSIVHKANISGFSKVSQMKDLLRFDACTPYYRLQPKKELSIFVFPVNSHVLIQ